MWCLVYNNDLYDLYNYRYMECTLHPIIKVGNDLGHDPGQAWSHGTVLSNEITALNMV